jgi:hypothetical protein
MSQLVSLDYPLTLRDNPKCCVGLKMIYNKITGSIEEKVNSSLTDNKALLQPALASLIDTIKRQPDIFSNLLMMSTGASIDQNYSPS